MFRKLLCITAVLLTASLSAFSQTGALKGKIIDKKTNEPIPFANIIIEEGGRQSGGTTTDFDGNYTIKPIPPGKYDLKATYVGYKPMMVKDVVIMANQISFQDITMESTAINIETFEVVDYKVPLISKDQTSTGGTITSDEIAKMPGRSAESVAITVGGVFSQDGSMGSIRGARSDGTVTYVDGVRTRSSSSVPKAAIEQVTVVTGGLPANYGDATGGILSISTKGASREFGMGFEGMTSELLDNFGTNLLALNVAGPLIKGKDSTQTTSLLGYFIAGEFSYNKDPRPSQVGYWYAKPDVLAKIQENPLIPTGRSTGGTVSAADFVRMNDLRKESSALLEAQQGVNVSGKLDVRTDKKGTTNLTFGGSLDYNWGKSFEYANMLFNWDRDPVYTINDWRVFGRFTQRFPAQSENKSLIKNVYYSIQAGYAQYTSTQEDENFKDNLFKYGYLGKFTTKKNPSYTIYTINGNTVYEQNGFKDSIITFEPSDINPILANYTKNYYNLYAGQLLGNYENATQVQLNGGLLNGDFPRTVNGLWNNVGVPYNAYSHFNQVQYTVDANGSADIGNHAIQFGISYEQLKIQSYTYNYVASLWTLMRQLVNKHIVQLDLDHPQLVFDDHGVFQDTINYDRLYSGGEQAFIDYNLRQKLGLPVNGKDWIDVDSYNPDMFSINMFSADELLKNGTQSIVSYYGYDPYGKPLKTNPSFDDFFTQKDDHGNYTRPIAAHQPIYMAGYVQDKFAFRDLIFSIGLRVDRYDANQKVLKDPYLLHNAKTVKEVTDLGEHPSNMGPDYVVYVDDLKNPTSVRGYRNGSTWYNAQGIEISDPAIIATASGIAPYLVDPNEKIINSSAFKDYKPQINYMPRVSFSFPISDEALFFAHYDVLTKRPTSGNYMNPTDYFFLQARQTDQVAISNPDLKSEKTIDYELGFQQKLSNSSSLKISAYYREMRNQVEVYRFSGAYPISYMSYNNIDFGTVKGLILQYDLRKTVNLWIKASYTLQFADGTGSDATSGYSFVNTGQPNLRTTTPLSYDRRHAIVAVVDYRFGSGKEYNGPKITRKIKGSDKVKYIMLLQNTGLDVTFNVGSGIPYSKSSKVIATQLGGSGYQLDGSINGSRMPWQYRIDVRLDRDITIKTGKKGKHGRELSMNVYLEINNILNTKNILNVYRATGNADDDGYLTDRDSQTAINANNDPQAFRDQYTIRMNSPYNYSLPRTIHLGVSLNL